MMGAADENTMRLSKVAREFNLGLHTLVEFLASKGHRVESNPNTKIGPALYALIKARYGSEPETIRVDVQKLAGLRTMGKIEIPQKRMGIPQPGQDTAASQASQEALHRALKEIADLKAQMAAVTEENRILKEAATGSKPRMIVLRGTDANGAEQSTSITLTEQFEQVLGLVENTNTNLFVTGKAGTGKSTLLQLIKQETKKNVAVVAFTGLAALNVKGKTINGFFGFPPHYLQNKDIKPDQDRRRMLSALDVLIIDEVSMVRSDMFSAIDKALRLAKGKRDIPFGGVQILLFGDPCQLSPIPDKKAPVQLFKNESDLYFYSTPSYASGAFRPIELQHQFRQADDPEFTLLLNEIREGKASKATLARLNSRVSIEQPHSTDRRAMGQVNLMARNTQVDAYNNERLNALAGPLEGPFTRRIEDRFERVKQPAPESLYLKVGAQVMMLKNQDGYVNGTIARIHSIERSDTEGDRITVMINGRIVQLNMATWDDYDHQVDKTTGKWKTVPCGKYIQYPIALAWAITIHKSQGLTFDEVRVDLGAGAFSPGQTYVALSRCRTLEGLHLTRPITEADIRIDGSVQQFISSGYKPLTGQPVDLEDLPEPSDDESPSDLGNGAPTDPDTDPDVPF